VPGGTPGRSDGLEWACTDFNTDGVHPSASGRGKVANALLAFYRSDTTATPWFLG
jgi:lysophospholipase L1-like esterase